MSDITNRMSTLGLCPLGFLTGRQTHAPYTCQQMLASRLGAGMAGRTGASLQHLKKTPLRLQIYFDIQDYYKKQKGFLLKLFLLHLNTYVIGIRPL